MYNMIMRNLLSDNILKRNLVDSIGRLYTSSLKTTNDIDIIDNMIKTIDDSDDEEFKKATYNIINIK